MSEFKCNQDSEQIYDTPALSDKCQAIIRILAAGCHGAAGHVILTTKSDEECKD